MDNAIAVVDGTNILYINTNVVNTMLFSSKKHTKQNNDYCTKTYIIAEVKEFNLYHQSSYLHLLQLYCEF